LSNEEHDAAIRVIKSNWLTQGKVTESLEKKISKILSVKHVIMVNNGTSALQCALLAHGIKPNDEVIVPTFTFAATVNAILSIGAKPVLVDSDPYTFNTSLEFIKSHITRKTKAILPVDVSGMPIDIKSFRDFSQKNDLILIEDAAEGLGAEFSHKKIGSFGHSTIFSFHMAKVVTAVEGGCLVTNDEQIAKNARLIRSHGSAKPYDSTQFGLNLRISDIHSAIALIQLKKLTKFLRHRNKIASLYQKYLQQVSFQKIPSYVTLHPYMLFAILVTPKKKNKVNAFLNKNGVETRMCWPPVHVQKYHSKLFGKSKFQNAEKIYSQIINLPMGNGLTENQAYEVIDITKKGLMSCR
jgi:perosamine synthetase